MDILVISPVNPFIKNSGDSIRIFQFIKYLSKNNTIHLICLTTKRNDLIIKNNDKERECYCKKTWVVYNLENKYMTLFKWIFSNKIYREVKFNNKKFSHIIKREVFSDKYDVILINFLDTVQHLKYDKMFNKSLIVLDQHNADQIWFESFLRSKSVVKKYFGKINLIRLSRVQEEYYRKVDLCFSVSKIDKEYTTKVVTKKSFIEVAPNGVDLNYFKSTRVNKKNNEIIFCGSMEVLMNQNAVLYFCKYIYPKIKKQIPDAKFNVVGKYPPVRIKRLHGSKNIFVTGTVFDVRPYYEKSKVAVAPFSLGGGTKLKILEAMAMNVPVVSTKIGCQGIEAVKNKHILVARNDDEFAAMVISCLKNYSKDIIKNAKKLVQKNYSWTNIVRNAEKRIHEVRKEKLNKFL